MVELTKKGGPIVVAHRGASGYMPENTIASFDKAVSMGVDMIELDVHPTRDGHLVVMHDDTVDRTTEGHGRVSTLTLEEIRGLNAAAKFPGGMRERVPTFAEVLERYSGRTPLAVEVKHGSSVYPGVERAVIDELDRHGAVDRVELISFDFDCLKKIRHESPHAKTGFIFVGNMASAAEMVGRGADALHGRWDFVAASQIEHARSLGFPCQLWTVNSDEEIRKVVSLAPDGIVSNYPDRVIEAVRRDESHLARD